MKRLPASDAASGSSAIQRVPGTRSYNVIDVLDPVARYHLDVLGHAFQVFDMVDALVRRF
jgi:hypothetical protein